MNPSNVPSATYNIYEQVSGFEDPGGFRPDGLPILVSKCGTTILESDFDRPVASALTLSPTYVDISSGGVTVTLSVRVSDTSGVDKNNSNRYAGIYMEEVIIF